MSLPATPLSSRSRSSPTFSETTSRRCDLVLDPFAGSGTTLIAAEKTGREACALEIDPTYADVIVQRWQSYSGKPALLAATGATFEELTEQRNPKAPRRHRLILELDDEQIGSIGRQAE